MAEIENNTFSRLLRISNIHSVVPTDTNTNFTINLNRMTETNNIVRCVLKSATFPNNSYNIHTSGALKNNEFDYEIVGDAVYTVSIPVDGFYTTTELINIIAPAIETQIKITFPADTFTMTVGAFSKKVESTWTGTTTLKFPGVKQLNKDLGNTVDSGNQNNSYTFDSLANLYGLKNVYIHTTTMAEGNLVDGDVENHDIIAEVPVDVAFGQLVHYQSHDDELDSINYNSVRNFDSINISLRDLKNNIVQLNGGETVFMFKIYYL